MHPAPTAWREARHLLNRAGFGGRPEEIEQVAGLSRAEAVERLLTAENAPLPQPDWLDEAQGMTYRRMAGLSRDERRKLLRAGREHGLDMTAQWLTSMAQAPTPADMLRQRMVFFWHGHFATSVQKVQQPAAVFAQLDLFHRQATGNYGELLHAIVRDPAMLRYLDNIQNRRGKPNENLARELMELFSLGQGNYTEADIREGARALTGYSIGDDGFAFHTYLHDDGEKTILGKTGHWNGDDFVNIILSQQACPAFISGKLWRYFAGTDAPPATSAELASVFRRANYDLKPLLRAIFTSDAFYSPEVMGQQIKSPVQLVAGTTRLLNVKLADPKMLLGIMRLLGQMPYLPPNVKGWPDGRAWIDTSRLISRFALAELIAQGGADSGMIRMMRDVNRTFTVDATPLAAGLTDPDQVVRRLADVLLCVPPDDTELAALTADYRRDAANLPPELALRRLAGGVMLLPQYQLA